MVFRTPGLPGGIYSFSRATLSALEIKSPFSAAEWLQTLEAVRAYIEMLEQSILQLSQSLVESKGSTEKLEQRVNRNSQTSDQTPSADGPFKKPERKKKKDKRKRGGQKGQAGHLQQLVDPTETVPLKPSVCSCVSPVFHHVESFFIPNSRLSSRKLSLKSLTTCFTKAAAAVAAETFRQNWTHHTGWDMVQG